MNKILILSNTTTDLSELLLAACPGSALYDPSEEEIPFDDFDALCVLGGTEERPFAIPAPHRMALEAMRAAGKPVFCEFVTSVAGVYSGSPLTMTHHRLVYSNEYRDFCGLRRGDVLDGHYNEYVPYYFVPGDARPILTYHDYVCAHEHIDMDNDRFRSGRLALWLTDDQTVICAFRLCQFNRARLAPRDHWQRVLEGIAAFLAGEPVSLTFPEPICCHEREPKLSDLQAAITRGLAWYRRADMLKKQGLAGVREGFSHHILARSGRQLVAEIVRADCTGETGGAFLLDYLRTGNPDSLAVYRNTADFCFNFMQVKEGPHRGMMRWTEQAWEVCSQDDVARAILPTLLCQSFGGGSEHFGDAVEALTYLAKTTDANGLRVARTDLCNFANEAYWDQIRQPGAGLAATHYNAYYHAALLLAVRGGADPALAEVAVKGLSSLMAIYPNTCREQSETEEMCRLILPLALLYEYTGSEEHYGWLRRVTADLERVEHPSGGYAEWDTGYTASCARNEHGECALLANNGDPVADLLYSNNWLPLGFAYAYLVTGETYFREKWEGIARFMLSCQIHSADEKLDGAWTRAMDMNRLESYGVPHDIGWAPCSVESGWTVGEILMGLQFMEIAERELAKKAE